MYMYMHVCTHIPVISYTCAYAYTHTERDGEQVIKQILYHASIHQSFSLPKGYLDSDNVGK